MCSNLYFQVIRELFQISGRLGDVVNNLVEPNVNPGQSTNERTFGGGGGTGGGLPTPRIQDQDLPIHLRIAIDQMLDMFPQLPRNLIVQELLVAGSPELAVENLIARVSFLQTITDHSLDSLGSENANRNNPASLPHFRVSFEYT